MPDKQNKCLLYTFIFYEVPSCFVPLCFLFLTTCCLAVLAFVRRWDLSGCTIRPVRRWDLSRCTIRPAWGQVQWWKRCQDRGHKQPTDDGFHDTSSNMQSRERSGQAKMRRFSVDLREIDWRNGLMKMQKYRLEKKISMKMFFKSM